MKFCYRFAVVGVLVLVLSNLLHAQIPPKREFRAAWIATVVNLDWPPSKLRGADVQLQRDDLASLLDQLKAAGINAIIFQVRPECDAFYPSSLEPWSYWLTGKQGQLTNGIIDPLQFVLDEAHKRGMEVHAWFNPYRAERQVGNYTLASNHVVVQHPDWVLAFGTLKMLDPGNPNARNHVLNVIADVVRRYEIDGVHWDDYFYPYSGTTNQDSVSWQLYNRGFTNKADWRRDNVNLLVKATNDSIKAIRPRVKFGISPFGIWKSGYPSGIVGTSAYDALYCDAVTWLNYQWIDYITPQLYWTFGYGQDYAKLAPWWASVANGRHLYPGLAAYKIAKSSSTSTYPSSDWPASDIASQIRLNRTVGHGSVFFRARFGVVDNLKGFADTLKNDLYKYRALRPIMSWKETTPPNVPTNLTITKNTSSAIVSWTAATLATDGELASEYVVYRSTSLPISYNDPRNIISIQSTLTYTETALPGTSVTYYYAVTALDRLQNESASSNIMGLNASGVVGIEEQVGPVAEFRLRQNYPNPFNPATIISFRIPSEQRVSLRVYDMLGREVRVLADGMMGSGDHQIQFDGSGLPTGVYIYRLIAGTFVESKKMQLIK